MGDFISNVLKYFSSTPKNSYQHIFFLKLQFLIIYGYKFRPILSKLKTKINTIGSSHSLLQEIFNLANRLRLSIRFESHQTGQNLSPQIESSIHTIQDYIFTFHRVVYIELELFCLTAFSNKEIKSKLEAPLKQTWLEPTCDIYIQSFVILSL